MQATIIKYYMHFLQGMRTLETCIIENYIFVLSLKNIYILCYFDGIVDCNVEPTINAILLHLLFIRYRIVTWRRFLFERKEKCLFPILKYTKK